VKEQGDCANSRECVKMTSSAASGAMRLVTTCTVTTSWSKPPGSADRDDVECARCRAMAW